MTVNTGTINVPADTHFCELLDAFKTILGACSTGGEGTNANLRCLSFEPA